MIQTILDLVYPPCCEICKARSSSHPFCPLCWEDCEIVAPLGRCPHCFEESERLCLRCIKKPHMAFPSAFLWDPLLPPLHLARTCPEMMGSFLLFQWSRLGWEKPDVILPMPGMEPMALDLADRLDVAYASIFSSSDPTFCDEECIHEDQTLLLLDRGLPLTMQKMRVDAVLGAFPKKGFLLSLFPHDTFDF